MTGATFWLGLARFGLAAQIDGFLLHGVLRWHHLLSGLRPLASEREHGLADAAFDTGMAGILLAGVVGLLVNRRVLSGIGAARGAAGLLFGFGLWHVLDAVLFHAILGLHRVHPTAEHPLVWDILWPAVFGLLPLLVAQRLRDARRDVREAAAPAGTAPALRRSSGTRRRRKAPPTP